MSRLADSARRLAGKAMLLGWPPDAFWAATPADLAMLADALAPDAGDAMGHADLVKLMERDGDGRDA